MTQKDKHLLKRASLVYLECADPDIAETLIMGQDGILVDWNPLESDTDALHLATVTRLFRGYMHYMTQAMEKAPDNSPHSTRRAIVNGACEVYTPKAYRNTETA